MTPCCDKPTICGVWKFGLDPNDDTHFVLAIGHNQCVNCGCEYIFDVRQGCPCLTSNAAEVVLAIVPVLRRVQ